jgi:hypothetical protein
MPAIPLYEGFHKPLTCIEADARFGRGGRYYAGGYGHGSEGDHAVPAHGAVALVVHEDHAQVGGGVTGRVT